MHYVIVGAGPAGVIAAETIRKTDRDGIVTLLGGESRMPYSRMTIPYFLSDEIGEMATLLRKEEHYVGRGIDFRHSRVVRIKPEDRTLDLEDDTLLSYDRLLLATGSRPVTPPIPGVDFPGVQHCWTLADAHRLRTLVKPGCRVVLVGAGFIGCIIMGALLGRGATVTLLEMENRMVPRMMDETGGELLRRWCTEKGVDVRTGTRITSIEQGNSSQDSSNEFVVYTETDNLAADLVVLASGVRPNLDIISGTGIAVEDGILVDHYLRTNQLAIYAAGDVAQGKDWSTGKQTVHAIQPTATEHGRVSAYNMAGIPTVYPGSFNMNVLDTMGLISTSMGIWNRDEGSEYAMLLDSERYKYIQLVFRDDVLIGSLGIGSLQFAGALRGLIQGKTRLGKWKRRLQYDPTRVMEAYVSSIRDFRT